MGGVDHDGLPELAPDRSGRSLGRVCWAENVADFANGLDAFVNQRDALFAARFVPLGLREVRRGMAGHEFDDVFELAVAEDGAEDVAQRAFLVRGDFDAEFLFERPLGLAGEDILELGAKHLADRAVEFHGLCHAHPMELDRDDEQAGAGEEIDHVARAAGREAEILGLDEHERALRLLPGLIADHALQHAAIRIGMLRPQLQLGFGFIRGWRREHGRFEVAHLVVLIDDQVAVCVANGFSAAAVGADIADDGAGFADRVLALEQKHHDAAAAPGLGIRQEVLENVTVNQLLDAAVLRVIGGDDRLRVLLHKLGAGREHARGRQFETGARDEPGQDSARARLVQRVGRDDDVSELLSHINGMPEEQPVRTWRKSRLCRPGS